LIQSEEVITPLISFNHNETKVSCEVALSAEELEEVIAPISSVPMNHNETIASDDVELSAEELEEVVAPSLGRSEQHNETIVSEEFELNTEDLEEVIAPIVPHLRSRATTTKRSLEMKSS
jgi:predicted small metal-binding protein